MNMAPSSSDLRLDLRLDFRIHHDIPVQPLIPDSLSALHKYGSVHLRPEVRCRLVLRLH